MGKIAYAQTPDAVKLFFVISLWFATLSGFAQTLGLMVRQYPTNPNMSGFVSWLIVLLVPVLLGAVLYFCRRSRDLSLTTLFEVTVLGFVGYLLHNSVTSLLAEFGIHILVTNSWIDFMLFFSILPAAVTIIVMTGIGLWLRRKNMW